MKKAISLLLSLLMALQFVTFTTGADATPAADITFSVSNASGRAGEDVEVTVSASSTVLTMSIGLLIDSYNEDVLEFSGFTNKDTALVGKAFLTSFDDDPAKRAIVLGFVDPADNTYPGEIADGVICNVKFRIKDGAAEGDYPVSMTAVAKNGAGDMTTTVIPGTVTVRPTGVAEFTFGTVKGLPGNTVDVPLTVKSVEYVSQLFFDTLAYDDTNLEFLGFFNLASGVLAAANTGIGDLESGTVTQFYAILDDPQPLDGKICDLRFKIKDTAAAGDYDVGMNVKAHYVSRTEATVTVGTALGYKDDTFNFNVLIPSEGPWSYLFWTDLAFDEAKLQLTGFAGTSNTNVNSSVDQAASVDTTAKEVKLVYAEPYTVSSYSASTARAFVLRFKMLADDDVDGVPVTMKLTTGVPATATATSVTGGTVHVHDLTKVEAAAATCETPGVTEAYWYCADCDTAYADEAATSELADVTARTIPATGHVWGTPSYEWAADKSKVTAKRICENDNSHVDTEEVNTTSVTTAATCTTGESTTYTAVFTKDGFTEQTETVTGDPLGHTWGEPTYEWATDYSKVTAKRVCTRDASHEETETVDTTIGSSSATCTVAGTTTYTATFTNTAFAEQTKTVTGEPLGHSWGEIEYTWADDNTTGTAKRVCTRDTSHVEEETVNTTSETTDATCTEAGKTVYTAVYTNTAFGTKTKEVTIPAKGHNMTEHTANAQTCTEAGNSAYWSCDQCNKFFADNLGNEEIAENSWVIPADGHAWGEIEYTWADDNSTVTAKRVCTRDTSHVEEETVNTVTQSSNATCTASGTTVIKATFTNPVFTEQTKETTADPLGHSLTKHAAKAAKCETAGNEEYWECSRCHKYFEDEAGTKEIKKDSWIIPALGHDWDEGTVLKEATKYWEGKIKYTCKNDPSHTKEEVIPKIKDDDEYAKWRFIADLLRKMAEQRAQQQNNENDKPEEPEETGWKNPFRDVSENDVFYEAVKFVNENGLFIGVEADRFAPESTMTRAMFVTVLGRLAGVDVSGYKTTSFTDVETGLWYSEYVEWAAEEGIILGYGDGTFGPEKLVTREQAVLIIQRYVKMCGIAADPSDYDLLVSDVGEVSDWALDAVKWGCENNIYVLDGGLLKARQPSSRANVAMLLLNLVDMLAD